MATLSLVHWWLNVAVDPSDSRALEIGEMEPTDAVQAEVREYLNGRRRVVRRAGGVKRTMRGLVRHPSVADVDFLVRNAGEVLIFRDPDGGKFAGMYSEVTQPRTGPWRDDVMLFVTRTTFSEAV
jgi:hypothetical protein